MLVAGHPAASASLPLGALHTCCQRFKTVSFVRALRPSLSVKFIIIKALEKIHRNASWKIQADAHGQLQPLGVQCLTIGVKIPTAADLPLPESEGARR